jgi:hypothetical protein
MARKFRMLDNPLGMIAKSYSACRVKGGARTHVFHGGAALCGAGRTREGDLIPGAIKRSGKKVARKEIDCLRCIKILKLDPGLTGSPTTVDYEGDKPVRSRVKGLTIRKFKPSGRKGEKRVEHVMVVGGRAGEEIAKRQPKGPKTYRRRAAEMMRLVDRRAYQGREISAKYGPHHVRDENEDGSRAFHPFRTGKLTKIKVARGKHRGKESFVGHPTQTVTSVYPWLARPVPAERPAAVPRRRVAATATRANPKRNAKGQFVAAKKNKKR